MSRESSAGRPAGMRARCDRGGLAVNIGDAERAASILAGAGLALGGLRRIDSLLGLALTAAGGGLIFRGMSGFCGMYKMLGVSTCHIGRIGGSGAHGSRLEDSIVINSEPEQVYAFWRHLENLPRFLNHLTSVESKGGGRSHWVAEGPLGVRVEWDAEITSDRPNELIAWRSLEGSQVDTAGSVLFTPEPLGRGTRVRVVLQYDPPGGRAAVVLAHLFGDSPEQQLAADLFRLKRVIEAGEVTPVGASGGQRSHPGDALPVLNRRDQVEESSGESFPASDPPAWTTSAANRPHEG